MGAAAEDGTRGETVVVVATAEAAASSAAPPVSINVADESRGFATVSSELLSSPVLTDPAPAAFGGSLNSRRYTNRISLALFLVHVAAAGAAMAYFIYKAVAGMAALPSSRRHRHERRALSFWVPPAEGAAVLSILLAFFWQKLVRSRPTILTVRFIIWFSFLSTLASGALLISFSTPASDALGLALIVFAVCVALYACWASRRMGYAARVLARALSPAEARFAALNRPAYGMMAAGAVWITLWCFAVIGAVYSFRVPAAAVTALVISLMWTAEVMRNVANLTVSRAVALYYLRGMQSDVGYCFQRAVTVNLGSACMGSLFVPTIELCRVVARALNLLEGEDEFLFSCAHCCLRVMETVFRYGNSWAYVHIAAYGRGFVEASQSTWGMFERRKMEPLVDSDITNALCFLSGVSSGSLCLIFAASWTFSSHPSYLPSVSLLSFFIGYLMTRIGMALTQACVGCYYVCYAENPTSRLFLNDTTITDRLEQIRTGKEPTGFTPHVTTTG
ncbi:protein PNS1-like [Wolffia australiana]